MNALPEADTRLVARLPALSGCYALVLELPEPAMVDIGRFGSLDFAPGFYTYVGSAFGGGGLRARVGRHWAGAGRRRWHVDYLRAVTRPVAAWYQVQQASREHHWAAALARGQGLEPVRNFGCTDCRCESHLFYSVGRPSHAAFRRRLGQSSPGDGLHHRLEKERLKAAP